MKKTYAENYPLKPLRDKKKALFLLSCASDLMDDYLALMKAIKQENGFIEDVVFLQGEIDCFISTVSKPDDVLGNPEKYWL